MNEAGPRDREHVLGTPTNDVNGKHSELLEMG